MQAEGLLTLSGEVLYRIIDFLPAVVGIISALVVLMGAFRSGILKKIRLGGFELEGVDQSELVKIQTQIREAKVGEVVPFEIEQLANYYSLSLGQARISFWFSLIFASIGFVVIIGAAVLYTDGDYGSALVKVISGLVIDAVAALFFVQSRRAQESMAAFFEKLRNDRQFAEARKICDEIGNEDIKDKLKTILVLHYSGLESGPMMSVLATAHQDGSQPTPIIKAGT